MDINYNELAKKYDLTRKENIDTINRFLESLSCSEGTNVLDFGCGTGNFTCALKRITNANVYGVEPADEMRQKAIDKSEDVVFKKGNHEKIPFEDSFFDFIYMTDVIHHIPDIGIMFKELNRVLKQGGSLCIVTESHKQIESRFWVKYFPTIVEVEKKRYPDIPEIIESAINNGFVFSKTETTDANHKHSISQNFFMLVENRGYSMFHLISNDDYECGLADLRNDFNKQVEIEYNHGETFVWLKKPFKG
ncbi:class I SAM-dependent methyltransferase [Methanosarcina spelaei]|uniref:class I SAM-dependent methyltransferase n=1 Tax=Methanosarcina spelaei TaxID=1036679 RepID=UPI001BAF9594|nr:class I SAM-dependent methyltransferase [Methanosarcina spelaei]